MAFLWALVGLAVGPLLNLLIYRLPRLEKLVAPFVCPQCKRPRPAYSQSALVASLLGDRGRCRECGTAPDRRAVGVELAAGVAFWLLMLHFGPSLKLLLYSLYSCFLIVVFFIDWEHRLILNRVTYPGVVLATVLTPLLSPVSPLMALLGVAVGGLTFGALYAGGHLVYGQEVLGMGDVKLAVMLGAMTGFPVIMAALLLGSFFGAVGAVLMLASRRRSVRDFMPYGTAMCLGAFAAFLVDLPLLY